jgi:hypothetical protein
VITLLFEGGELVYHLRDTKGDLLVLLAFFAILCCDFGDDVFEVG